MARHVEKDHVYNHACNYITVGYQQIVYASNIANQIHGFTIDYGKFILIRRRLFFSHANIHLSQFEPLF